MNQDKSKEFQEGDLLIPTICEEESIENLIENFKKLKQQNSSLLERVRFLENREKIDNKLKQNDSGRAENLLKVPNNSSSDPSSSISVSPDISCTDSISDAKPLLVQTLSSSEEELDTDFNEGKHLENSSGFSKKYGEKENADLESPITSKKCGQKEHKTAWSKMKEIITTTKVGGTKKRHISEDAVDFCKLSDETTLANNQGGIEGRLQAPRLVLTHPSTEDLNRPRSLDGNSRKLREKHRPSPLQPTWQESSPVDEEGQGETSPPLARKSSKWFKVKNVFLPSPGSHSNRSTSNPSSPLNFKSFTYEVDPEVSSSYDHLDENIFKDGNIQDEVKRNYKQLQKKLSDEFHCKFVEWEKGRKCGGSFSSGNSSVDECERRRFQETEELRSYGGGPDINTSPQEKKLTTEFKKKLEEWDRLKSGNDPVPPSSPGGSRDHPRRKISDWQGWGRVNSQRKKDDGKKRRGSDSPTRKEGHSIKEMAWIDKELAKVDKEKIRLEKEREKFNQREARLKKMKLALEASREEVLIPTSTGTFRFHGISEKFTKKLYEWEKAKGIGPEASTIALLDPTYSLKATNHNPGESSGPGLMRSKSIGSVADLGTSACQITNHPSSLSLNNVGMLEEPMNQMVSPIKDEREIISSNAVTPDFSLVPDDTPHLIDSSGSDLDHEMVKISKNQGGYQYCDESKCLIEKLKKEREMCRELEQNIESLEGRISELSKSLERIDSGGSRNCGILHDDPFKIKTQQENEQEEYTSTEECDAVRGAEIPCTSKEDLNELWLIGRDQALNQVHCLTDHLLQIVEKLDSWANNPENDQETPLTSEHSSMMDKIDFWLSSSHHPENNNFHIQDQETVDLSSFTNKMKEKIREIRRVLGYLYSKKDGPSENLDCVNGEDELCETEPRSYLYGHDDKSTNDMGTQDTENDCSSRASSFTYQVPEFQDKHYDENWEWNKQTAFRPFQKDNFPFHHLKHLQCLQENESCSSYSDIEGNLSSNDLYRNIPKNDFSVHEMSSPMGCLTSWSNQTDSSIENQFEIISDISPNIVVPTVRKIFSPVFLEENGETSFIEVVINDNSPKIEEIIASVKSREDLDKNDEDEILSNENEIGDLSKSPEIACEEECIDEMQQMIISKNSQDETYSAHNINNNDIANEQSKSIQNDRIKDEEQNNSIESEDETKPFFDIGFPPISPLRGRREFRIPKDTSPLKRMIAARQNKRLYEIDLNERNQRSESSSPDSKSSERTSEVRIDRADNQRIYNTIGSDFKKIIKPTHSRAMSTDRCLPESSSNQSSLSNGFLKSNSTSALKYPIEFEQKLQSKDINKRKSIICESISVLEEKNKVDQHLSTPESLRLRALKIQKAKEDFFNAQLQDLANLEVQVKSEPKLETKNETKNTEKNDQEKYFTKSASEGTINLTNQELEQVSTSKPKSKFSGFTSKLNEVLRRSGTNSADSSLRRSLAIPSNHQVRQEEDSEPTRSCPSSPILLRDEPTWWSLNPAKKIFRPKGKYKINNNK